MGSGYSHHSSSGQECKLRCRRTLESQHNDLPSILGVHLRPAAPLDHPELVAWYPLWPASQLWAGFQGTRADAPSTLGVQLPIAARDRAARTSSHYVSWTYVLIAACACRATQIFPALPKYLKAGGPEEAEAQRDLKDQLTQLDSHLKSQGPWIMGHSLSAGDLALGPKLHHVQLTCKHFKVMPHFCAISAWLLMAP